MYLCREMTDISLPRIGSKFGRDHTTVIHACEKISKMRKEDKNFDEIYTEGNISINQGKYDEAISIFEKLLNQNQNIENDLNLIFDQNAALSFSEFLIELNKKENTSDKINLFFGPEAGLTKSDIDKIANPIFVKMNDNRLRSETAIITAASLITNMLD